MTPFGEKLRQLRAAKGVSLKTMAAALGVSPAYLSALEHGKRGQPTYFFVQRTILFFNIIWDEAEELVHLAQLSNPRVAIDTAGLSPRATEFANRLARQIDKLDESQLATLLALLPREGPG
ncbi:helix-turn-helix domain-containing protein [Beijerinckia indica]|uniref:Transcriptional regulator, XRE family n=1 Tax=Beijerinckia indica subsp. indica (strain ATCC 9039 / DSM 1715 / NCIMB 8712) TaxID=395963 RepID=B2IC78_BEII9|nr:transcriptional regulator [Beijerinckia indica]ACB96675.1 transcriptional regulator, XRE family [Beijerinckia indica subsp. indica ATCC 9039]